MPASTGLPLSLPCPALLSPPPSVVSSFSPFLRSLSFLPFLSLCSFSSILPGDNPHTNPSPHSSSFLHPRHVLFSLSRCRLHSFSCSPCCPFVRYNQPGRFPSPQLKPTSPHSPRLLDPTDLIHSLLLSNDPVSNRSFHTKKKESRSDNLILSPRDPC